MGKFAELFYKGGSFDFYRRCKGNGKKMLLCMQCLMGFGLQKRTQRIVVGCIRRVLVLTLTHGSSNASWVIIYKFY
jgi:hypothetical protein